jgi:MYXO-CTERM domain-containing protein
MRIFLGSDRRAVVALLVLLLSTLVAPARAGTGSINLIDGSGLEYFLNTQITSSTTSSASGAASEASFPASIQASTTGGASTMTQLTDAFDGYSTLALSFAGSVPTTAAQTGDPNFEFYNNLGMAPTLDASCNDRQVIFPTKTFTSGLDTIDVQRLVFVPSNDSFIRWANVFHNTSLASVTFQIGISGNLGSDSNTRVTASSSGDLVGDATDRWVATFQNFSGSSSTDPRLGHVLAGANSPRSPVAFASFADGDDTPFWWYTMTLAPGATGIIVTYSSGHGTKAAAAAKAAELSGLTNAHQMDCLSATQRAQIYNFSVQCSAPADEGMTCDDGDLCTQDDVCHAGQCVGQPKACRSNAADCTGVCNPANGSCEENNLPDGTVCSNGNLCDGTDTCQSGACTLTGAAPDCNDHDLCTTDSCVAATGCVNAMKSGCRACGAGEDAGADEDAGTLPGCNDNNLCNGVETCGSDDTCHAGTYLNCNDGNPCTLDACAPPGGCFHQMITGCMECNSDDDCKDNDVCDGDEVCRNGACHADVVPDCNDNDDCTMDQCSAADGCTHTAIMSGSCRGRAGAGGSGAGAGGSRAGAGGSSSAGAGGSESADAGPDAGMPAKDDDGCGCSTSGRGSNTTAGIWMLVLAWLTRRRKVASR